VCEHLPYFDALEAAFAVPLIMSDMEAITTLPIHDLLSVL